VNRDRESDDSGLSDYANLEEIQKSIAERNQVRGGVQPGGGGGGRGSTLPREGVDGHSYSLQSGMSSFSKGSNPATKNTSLSKSASVCTPRQSS